MNTKNILAISNLTKDIEIDNQHNNFNYSLNTGKIVTNNIINTNSYKALHKNAFEQKIKYIDLISNLNKKFITNFNHNNQFSYFFLSDLSVKRTEYIKSFLYLNHLKTISEIITKYSIDEIHIFDCEKEFLQSLERIFNKKIIIKKNKKNKLNFFKVLFILKQVKFIMKFFVIISYLKFFSFYKNPKLKNNLFYSSFPQNFNGFKSTKYQYDNNKSQFLISITTDLLHQNISIFNY